MLSAFCCFSVSGCVVFVFRTGSGARFFGGLPLAARRDALCSYERPSLRGLICYSCCFSQATAPPTCAMDRDCYILGTIFSIFTGPGFVKGFPGVAIQYIQEIVGPGRRRVVS